MKKIVLVFLVLFCFSGSAFAGRSIVVAVPAAIPPMAFVGDDGQLTGYSVEYIKAVAEAADFEVVLKNIPWSGIFAGLVRGEFDAICGAVSITEKRKKVVDFTKPYFEVWHALAVRTDSDAKSLADLKGKRVGGKIGSTSFQALNNVEGLEATGYAEASLLLAALKEKQVDAVVYDEVMVHYDIEKHYKDTLKITAILDSEEVDLIGIAVKKGNSEVLDLLNKGMAAVKGSDAEKEIRKKWLSDREK
jgi:polar amino acid transport system substrate-binding protein